MCCDWSTASAITSESRLKLRSRPNKSSVCGQSPQEMECRNRKLANPVSGWAGSNKISFELSKHFRFGVEQRVSHPNLIKSMLHSFRLFTRKSKHIATGAWTKRHQSGQKSPFKVISAPPGCEVRRNWSRSGPQSPR